MEKVMGNLTEKWKNKKLEWHKSYYCKNKKGDVCISTLMGDDTLYSQELGGNLNFEYWEVLAPVPSYQECQQLNERLLDMIDLLQKCYFYLNAVADEKVKTEHLEQIKTLAVLIYNAIGERNDKVTA